MRLNAGRHFSVSNVRGRKREAYVSESLQSVKRIANVRFMREKVRRVTIERRKNADQEKTGAKRYAGAREEWCSLFYVFKSG